jgi:WXXGXW repeat (2 copies)
MLQKIVLAAVVAALGFAAVSTPAQSAAYVYVQAGPPAAVVETVPASPGTGYVWVGGYYRWDGAHYNWVHGTWVRHGGAWCAGHWRHHPSHGWYWVPGRWC